MQLTCNNTCNLISVVIAADRLRINIELPYLTVAPTSWR